MAYPARTITGIRLLLSFLLAPLVTIISLDIALDVVAAYFAACRDSPLSDWGVFGLGIFLLYATVIVYVGAIFVFLPCLLLARDMGHSGLRTIMAPTAVLSLIYATLTYAGLREQYTSLFAAATAVLFVPGVLLSGLCLWFIGVWRLPKPSATSSSIEKSETEPMDTPLEEAGRE